MQAATVEPASSWHASSGVVSFAELDPADAGDTRLPVPQDETSDAWTDVSRLSEPSPLLSLGSSATGFQETSELQANEDKALADGAFAGSPAGIQASGAQQEEPDDAFGGAFLAEAPANHHASTPMTAMTPLQFETGSDMLSAAFLARNEADDGLVAVLPVADPTAYPLPAVLVNEDDALSPAAAPSVQSLSAVLQEEVDPVAAAPAVQPVLPVQQEVAEGTVADVLPAAAPAVQPVTAVLREEAEIPVADVLPATAPALLHGPAVLQDEAKGAAEGVSPAPAPAVQSTSSIQQDEGVIPLEEVLTAASPAVQEEVLPAASLAVQEEVLPAVSPAVQEEAEFAVASLAAAAPAMQQTVSAVLEVAFNAAQDAAAPAPAPAQHQTVVAVVEVAPDPTLENADSASAAATPRPLSLPQNAFVPAGTPTASEPSSLNTSPAERPSDAPAADSNNVVSRASRRADALWGRFEPADAVLELIADAAEKSVSSSSTPAAAPAAFPEVVAVEPAPGVPLKESTRSETVKDPGDSLPGGPASRAALAPLQVTSLIQQRAADRKDSRTAVASSESAASPDSTSKRGSGGMNPMKDGSVASKDPPEAVRPNKWTLPLPMDASKAVKPARLEEQAQRFTKDTPFVKTQGPYLAESGRPVFFVGARPRLKRPVARPVFFVCARKAAWPCPRTHMFTACDGWAGSGGVERCWRQQKQEGGEWAGGPWGLAQCGAGGFDLVRTGLCGLGALRVK